MRLQPQLDFYHVNKIGLISCSNPGLWYHPERKFEITHQMSGLAYQAL